MTGPASGASPRFVELADEDGRTTWRLDTGFLGSGFRCLWGDGCQGIHDERRPELMDGCCSVGVVLADEAEAMNVAALGAAMGPACFERAGAAPFVERRNGNWVTRVVDGACVFFNRPGFAGGPGCALHLGALADGDDPVEWKPRTCSRVPVRVDERRQPDGSIEVTVRAWRREDWGPGGATMAWWCTEAPEAFDAPTPLYERISAELRDVMGEELHERAVAALRAQGRPIA